LGIVSFIPPDIVKDIKRAAEEVMRGTNRVK